MKTSKHILVCAGAAAQVTITIDKAKQYQKIEGFGGLAQESYDWGPNAVMSDKFADDLVNDLGCTVFRHIIDGGLEPTNDNNDPNNTDLTKFNLGSESGCKSNAHMTLNTILANGNLWLYQRLCRCNFYIYSNIYRA